MYSFLKIFWRKYFLFESSTKIWFSHSLVIKALYFKDLLQICFFWWVLSYIPHISEKADLDDFFNHKNSIHSKIKFTIKNERKWWYCLPFLDTMLKKNNDVSIYPYLYTKMQLIRSIFELCFKSKMRSFQLYSREQET